MLSQVRPLYFKANFIANPFGVSVCKNIIHLSYCITIVAIILFNAY